MNRGIDRASNNDKAGAEKDFTVVIQMEPNNSEAYNRRGNVRADLGHNRDADADYSKAIELNPYYASRFDNRGWLRRKLNFLPGASPTWTRPSRSIPIPPATTTTGRSAGPTKATARPPWPTSPRRSSWSQTTAST